MLVGRVCSDGAKPARMDDRPDGLSDALLATISGVDWPLDEDTGSFLRPEGDVIAARLVLMEVSVIGGGLPLDDLLFSITLEADPVNIDTGGSRLAGAAWNAAEALAALLLWSAGDIKASSLLVLLLSTGAFDFVPLEGSFDAACWLADSSEVSAIN